MGSLILLRPSGLKEFDRARHARHLDSAIRQSWRRRSNQESLLLVLIRQGLVGLGFSAAAPLMHAKAVVLTACPFDPKILRHGHASIHPHRRLAKKTPSPSVDS